MNEGIELRTISIENIYAPDMPSGWFLQTERMVNKGFAKFCKKRGMRTPSIGEMIKGELEVAYARAKARKQQP